MPLQLLVGRRRRNPSRQHKLLLAPSQKPSRWGWVAGSIPSTCAPHGTGCQHWSRQEFGVPCGTGNRGGAPCGWSSCGCREGEGCTAVPSGMPPARPRWLYHGATSTILTVPSCPLQCLRQEAPRWVQAINATCHAGVPHAAGILPASPGGAGGCPWRPSGPAPQRCARPAPAPRAEAANLRGAAAASPAPAHAKDDVGKPIPRRAQVRIGGLLAVGREVGHPAPRPLAGVAVFWGF